MTNSYNGHLILGDIKGADFTYSVETDYSISYLNQNMHRSRNDAGIQYGPTHDAMLEVKINIVPNTDTLKYDQLIKPFYERLNSDEEYYYSVLYNLVVSAKSEESVQKIQSYSNGFVARGYIVRIEEEYSDGKQNTLGAFDSILLTVKIQLTQVCFLGDSSANDKTIRIFA